MCTAHEIGKYLRNWQKYRNSGSLAKVPCCNQFCPHFLYRWQYHELHTSIIIPWMFLTITKRKLKSWRRRKTPLLLSSFCHSLLVIWSALLLLTVVNFYRKESSLPIFAHNLAGSVLKEWFSWDKKSLLDLLYGSYYKVDWFLLTMVVVQALAVTTQQQLSG